MFLDPFGNFDLSMVIPGYEQTNFAAFKAASDPDASADGVKNNLDMIQ